MMSRDRAFAWATAIVIVVVWLAFFASVALLHARDLGQWAGEDQAIASWFQTLMQPDNPTVSCCGQADAYWADQVETGPHGETIAVITDEREDEPLMRHHVPVGTRIVVPNKKIKFDKGNPTGHIVIFLDFENAPYCYVQSGGV